MTSVLKKLEKILGKEAREQIIADSKEVFPEMREQIFLGDSKIRRYWFKIILELNTTFLKEWLEENRIKLNERIKAELEELSKTLTHKALNEQEIENCNKVMKMILKNPKVDHVGYVDIYNGKWHYTDLARRVIDLKIANKMLEELEDIHFRIIKKHLEPVSGKNIEKEIRKLRAKKSYYKNRIQEKLQVRKQVRYIG